MLKYLILASLTIAAQSPALAGTINSIKCTSPSQQWLSVGLTKESGVWSGWAQAGYDHSSYTQCNSTRNSIDCKGFWVGGKAQSNISVKLAAGKKITAVIMDSPTESKSSVVLQCEEGSWD
jgi:hypothetical protein